MRSACKVIVGRNGVECGGQRNCEKGYRDGKAKKKITCLEKEKNTDALLKNRGFSPNQLSGLMLVAYLLTFCVICQFKVRSALPIFISFTAGSCSLAKACENPSVLGEKQLGGKFLIHVAGPRVHGAQVFHT